eukprot:scaffold222287_cov40-Tisochrysis_lutea.AAC.2
MLGEERGTAREARGAEGQGAARDVRSKACCCCLGQGCRRTCTHLCEQVNSDPQNAFTLRRGIATARRIVVNHGVTALWRGNSAAIARDVPYASIVFSSYAL